MPDAHKNFSYSTVAAAPSPPASGTTLSVAAGHGARFPAAPFNCTVWPANQQPTLGNAEIVRVTAVNVDEFTIARTQEGSSAMDIAVGYQIAATITAKTLTDVEGQVAAHEAAGDPHPQYLTQSEADALFLTQSEADALFLTPAEGDAAYVNVGGDTMTGDLLLSGAALASAFSTSVLTLRGGGSGADVFRLNTWNNSRVLTINLSAQLGINTTDPQAMLDVNGASGIVVRAVQGSTRVLELTVSGAVATIREGGGLAGDELRLMQTAAGILTLWTNSAERIHITSAGDVGIGAAPTATVLLELSRGVGDTIFRITNTTAVGDPYISFYMPTVQEWVMGMDDSDVDKFKIAASGALDSSSVLTMTVGGFVGIGTQAPLYLLEVAG